MINQKNQNDDFGRFNFINKFQNGQLKKFKFMTSLKLNNNLCRLTTL